MSIVYVPGPLRELLSTKEMVEICDFSGNLLGSFVPAATPEKRKPCDPPPLSEEELQRIESEEEITTDELFETLGIR